MKEDDFMNIDISSVDRVTPRETKEVEAGDIGVSPSSSYNRDIIERTIHTIHTIRIYPNGQIFMKPPMSWLDKKGTIVKTKEKRKPIKVEKAVLQKEEVY